MKKIILFLSLVVISPLLLNCNDGSGQTGMPTGFPSCIYNYASWPSGTPSMSQMIKEGEKIKVGDMVFIGIIESVLNENPICVDYTPSKDRVKACTISPGLVEVRSITEAGELFVRYIPVRRISLARYYDYDIPERVFWENAEFCPRNVLFRISEISLITEHNQTIQALIREKAENIIMQERAKAKKEAEIARYNEILNLYNNKSGKKQNN